MEGFALVEPNRISTPLFGLDLIGDVSLKRSFSGERFNVNLLTRPDSLWVGPRLASKAGDTLRLIGFSTIYLRYRHLPKGGNTQRLDHVRPMGDVNHHALHDGLYPVATARLRS